ncbi:MAG: hypothetical protein KAQ68_07355 [Clostridiales bacterium]|nr:hypothetical protein [Clostridiales bacterium]
MKVIILNSAPGVGKSTLLKYMERNLPSSFALIDGDDVGRIVPLELSKDWLNLIQDNIVSCAINYMDFGIKYLIVAFVFPSKERVDRFINLLKNESIGVLCTCSLICNDTQLSWRIRDRNTSRIVNIERALEYNEAIKQLEADVTIDTTERTPQEVGELACDAIINFNKNFMI